MGTHFSNNWVEMGSARWPDAEIMPMVYYFNPLIYEWVFRTYPISHIYYACSGWKMGRSP